MVSSREFHLAHSGFFTTMGSWVAVEPNGTGLPSTLKPPRLGALLPSPRRVLSREHISTLINFSSNHQNMFLAPLYLYMFTNIKNKIASLSKQ